MVIEVKKEVKTVGGQVEQTVLVIALENVNVESCPITMETWINKNDITRNTFMDFIVVVVVIQSLYLTHIVIHSMFQMSSLSEHSDPSNSRLYESLYKVLIFSYVNI